MIVIVYYEDYLKLKKSISFEEALNLHKEMLEEIGVDEVAVELYKSLSAKASRYSGFRSEWVTLSKEQKIDKDSSRTSCHDSMIIEFNKLARYLRSVGKKAEWRDVLGEEKEDPYNRKKIGDFGCYLALINALNAR